METKRPDIMIIDTDRQRTKSFRRMLRRARPQLSVEECSDCQTVHDTIIDRRPTVALLHSTFPYTAEDGGGLLEELEHDFRAHHTGVILVLPISGSLLYRSGNQEGLEFLDMANDLVTTDFTEDMVCSVVLGCLDSRLAAETERVTAIETATEPVEATMEPAYSFVSKK